MNEAAVSEFARLSADANIIAAPRRTRGFTTQPPADPTKERLDWLVVPG